MLDITDQIKYPSHRPAPTLVATRAGHEKRAHTAHLEHGHHAALLGESKSGIALFGATTDIDNAQHHLSSVMQAGALNQDDETPLYARWDLDNGDSLMLYYENIHAELSQIPFEINVHALDFELPDVPVLAVPFGALCKHQTLSELLDNHTQWSSKWSVGAEKYDASKDTSQLHGNCVKAVKHIASLAH